MTWHRRPSRLSRTDKDAVLRAHAGICHVCHHPGATQVDHLVNVTAWIRQQIPGDYDHPNNLAPIHGTPDGQQPCPTCGATCHKDKTQDEARRGRVRRTRTREQHPGLTRE
jgi:hypothetical protein